MTERNVSDYRIDKYSSKSCCFRITCLGSLKQRLSSCFPSPQFVCTVIAILLHYFYMCTFAWMFVEGLHIYRMLTELRNINHGHIRFYYAMGWGIPAIITGETTATHPDTYSQPRNKAVDDGKLSSCRESSLLARL